MTEASQQTQLLLDLLQQQRHDSILLSAISSKMEMLDDLYKRVFSGENSMNTQIVTLQYSITELQLWRDTTQDYVQKIAIERSRGHWLIFVACVAGLFSVSKEILIFIGRFWR